MPPLLGPGDLSTRRPRRILVAGTSGAGKTPLAARVAVVFDAPHIEIDGLFHGPSWTPRSSFVADVERFSAEDDWVTEWQYRAVRTLLVQRADLVLWLDLPRATVMRQVIRRTLARRLRRQRLWNGNVEPPIWRIFTDPGHIVRWAWRTHSSTARRMADAVSRRPDLPVVRFRSHRDADTWLRDQRHHCTDGRSHRAARHLSGLGPESPPLAKWSVSARHASVSLPKRSTLGVRLPTTAHGEPQAPSSIKARRARVRVARSASASSGG